MFRRPSCTCLLALLAAPALLAAAPAAPPAPAATDLHAWEAGDDPAALDTWVHGHLTRADADVAKLLAASGARSVANTLRPYDDAVNELNLAVFQASVLYGVGTTKELRDKAQALTQTANAALTALNLNQAVYQALATLPAPDDAATRHYLERTLLEYRLAGVDKDEATRKKIVALQDKVTGYGLAFERAVHEDLHTMLVPKAELVGMPADYLAAHPADAQGQVKITSDYPDVRPVRRFADSTDLRHKAYLLYAQRGYPGNTDTLRKLLATREELAHVLGYRTWADFAMADQMMGSPAKLAEFLKQIDSASREPSEREDRALVAFAHGRDASITKLSVADQAYWTEQYRRAKFDFDSQSVRPYFPYAQVERGVIATASKLFHVDIRPVAGVRTWHPSVTVYDVYDGSRRIGRIYMDMHPRDGKDKWFSTQALTPGLGARQLPEATLVCNFPGGKAGDPGLMQYDDVVVFLHEFGHMMHHVIGGQHGWAGAGAFNVEGDFVEAPSQMLEEFFHDYGVLGSFAHHYQTGAVLPRALFDRMIKSDAFGRAGGRAVPADLRGRIARLPHARPGEARLRCRVPARLHALQHRDHAVGGSLLGELHAPERLQLELLHLRARQGDRAGFLRTVRPQAPARRAGRHALPPHGARAGREQARRAAGARLPRPGHESRGLPALDAGGVRGPGRGCAGAGYGFRIRSLRRSRSLENGEFFCTSTRR